MNEVFLDTSFAIAVSAETDVLHEQAKILVERLKAERITMVTTRAVLLEIGNALSKPRHRQAAGALLRSLERDPKVEILELSEQLYAAGLDLYCGRPDKAWSLIDCISFVVMRERGIVRALSADEHFRQAGFDVLLGGY